jgi:hypothetical protein
MKFSRQAKYGVYIPDFEGKSTWNNYELSQNDLY